MSVHDALVLCADIGSVRRGNFAWASNEGVASERIEDLPDVVVQGLLDGRHVALGFECPGWIPVPANPIELGRARAGEGACPWSGGPGAAVLATGIAQIAWVLEAIVCKAPGKGATCHRGRWGEAAPLLLWEAFVAGDRKTSRAGGHCDDARAGIAAFEQEARLGEPGVGGVRAVNMLTLLAVWAGLCIGDDELREAPPVYAPPRVG